MNKKTFNRLLDDAGGDISVLQRRAAEARKRAETWGEHLPRHIAIERREAILRWLWVATLVVLLGLAIGYLAAQTSHG